MKNILGFFLLIISSSTYAQFQAGTKISGPGLSINYIGSRQTSQNIDNSGNSLYLGGSFSVINMSSTSSGKGVRLNLSYLNNSFKRINTNADNNKQLSIGIDLFKRKYYNLKVNNLFFYIDRLIGVSYNTTKYDKTNNPKQNEFNASLSLTPGFNYILKKNLLLDLSLSKIGSLDYNHNITELNGIKNTTNKFGFNSELSANLLSNIEVGLRFIL